VRALALTQAKEAARWKNERAELARECAALKDEINRLRRTRDENESAEVCHHTALSFAEPHLARMKRHSHQTSPHL